MLDCIAMRLIPVRLWTLAILSGVLQVLPFPIAGPAPVWRTAFCWFALTPLLVALISKDSRGRPLRVYQGAILGYASGFFWYLGNCYWVYATMHLYGGIAKPAAAGILVLFCLYLALYHALFAALITCFRRANIWGNTLGVQGALLLSPFAWVAVELARARVTGFPWDLLGITQVDNLFLTRLAPYCGAYGLSFVIAAVNALWLLRITLKQRRYMRPALIVACVAILLLVVVFEQRIQAPAQEQTSASATLLQENLEVGAMAASAGTPLTKNEMLKAFSQLSLFPPNDAVCNGIPELPGTQCSGPVSAQQEAESVGTRYLQPTDLIVWPEAPNGFFESDPEFREAISRLARAAEAPIIVGNIGIDADSGVKRGYDLYNSADYIQPDGSFVGRYDKMHLVPFGEYTPYKRLFFFAGSLLQDVGLFDPGKSRTVFPTGGHTYGTFICYESVFGDEMRQYAKMGADVLVNISDDGWYGDTSAAWEHLNMVRMRAIENHRWVLRATNTGVTAAIDPYGRVVSSTPRHMRTSLRARFNYEHDVTFYSAHGDLFAYFCALVTVCGLGLGLLCKTA
ncbi:MAG TPA: apolipoprotein N-acyltransferase [Acidobacteriaceae bacterium]|nr:apolipoprotein N-acyltransferase [Acidobacteriaceae bacterium]